MWTTSLLLCLVLQNSQDTSIQQLLTRIETLEKRVQELEKERQPLSSGPAAVAHEIGSHDLIPAQTAPPDALGQPQYPSLQLRGFTDFTASASGQKGTHSGFNEGQFTLHLVSALAPRVNFFSELTLTARPDGGMGVPAVPGFNAEVERSIVRFDQSDAFKVSFGRYHTPINWWNTAFHHGQWLQTTVSRPEMAQVGGRFIPIHFVGAQVEGILPALGMNLNYNVGIGNGRGAVLSRAGDAGDTDNNKAWLANISARPDKARGLQFGGSVYQDRISLAGDRNFREWITSGHVIWNRENPEIIAEAANVTHKDLAGILPTSHSQAFYIQSAYRLPLARRVWKPYYRFEYIHIPKSDLPFRGVPNLSGSVAGLRYDLTEFAALKFEYRHQRRAPDVPRTNTGFMQMSFTF